MESLSPEMLLPSFVHSRHSKHVLLVSSVVLRWIALDCLFTSSRNWSESPYDVLQTVLFFSTRVCLYTGFLLQEPDCVFESDTSTVEAALRTAIFMSDREEAARVLRSDDVASLGAGLTYRRTESCLVTKSTNRTRDPDIVAIQVSLLY